MSRTFIPILVVLVVIGLLAWARPDFRQQLTQYGNRTNASAKVAFAPISRSLSNAGAQIAAYFHTPGSTTSSKTTAAKPDTSVQTFFANLIRQISQLIDSIIAWFRNILSTPNSTQNPTPAPK